MHSLCPLLVGGTGAIVFMSIHPLCCFVPRHDGISWHIYNKLLPVTEMNKFVLGSIGQIPAGRCIQLLQHQMLLLCNETGE